MGRGCGEVSGVLEAAQCGATVAAAVCVPHPMSLQDRGLERDWGAALRLYGWLADAGDPGSMNSIGCLHYYGGHGVKQNYATAANWFRRAAMRGDGLGYCNIGECYYYGKGVTKDLATARRYIKEAENKGSVKGIGMLGTMMFKGEGGDRKLSEGVALWERAAAMGDPQARANLDALGALDASSFPLVDEEVNLNPHL